FRPLKRVLERFALYYNRTRGRAGHVFKDRFHSACIRSETSFLCVVAYTDHNPIRAGLAEISTDYEFGSASSYVLDRAPAWLDRQRIARCVPDANTATGQIPEESYLRTFGKVDFDFVRELIRRRRHPEKHQDDPLDWFLSPDRARRIGWLVEQARLADGSKGARLLAKATTLREVLETHTDRRDWRRCDRTGDGIDWRSMLIGLLRLGCARSCRQISAMLQISESAVVRGTRRHVERLTTDPVYLAIAEEILVQAVRRTFAFLPPFPAVGPDGELRRPGDE
ncbi:MAG: hypothetical protein ABFS86_20300, partial [Planctomycetota bacterium]